MTNEEYYRNWAAEYERSAEVIQGNIDKLKEKAKTANIGELQAIGGDISTQRPSMTAGASHRNLSGRPKENAERRRQFENKNCKLRYGQ